MDSLIHELNKHSSSNIPNCLFFADDRLLLTKTEQYEWKMLKIAARWAKENGMIYKVSKCDIIYTHLPTVSHRRFILSDDIILIVSTYKYFRFPIISDRIDFPIHIQNQITTTSSFLKFMQVQYSE